MGNGRGSRTSGLVGRRHRRVLTSVGLAALLASAACGADGGQQSPSQEATGGQGATVSSTAASALPATTVKTGNFFSTSLASERGYKYGVTISTFTIVTQPADPGFTRFSYSGQITIANETPDRKTPNLTEVSVKLSYDSRTASELESSINLTPERTPVVPFNCTSQLQSRRPYCEADINFHDPQPMKVEIGGSVTVKTVTFRYGWTAREADAAKVVAFLERPALVIVEFKEDHTYISNAPVAPLRS